MQLSERQNLLFDQKLTAVAVVTDSVEVILVGSQYIRYRSVDGTGGWRHCCFGLVVDDGVFLPEKLGVQRARTHLRFEKYSRKEFPKRRWRGNLSAEG